MQEPVNSPAWWNEYFDSEWDRYGGGEQTRTFMQALLSGLHDCERSWLGADRRTILDWGCACGEGVAELGSQFPSALPSGLDVAAEALVRARQNFPAYRFHGADEIAQASFDAVFCSNCLEHFADTASTLARISALAENFLAVLVPYAEEPLSEYHLVSFTERSFPRRLGRLELSRTVVIDVPEKAWPGGRQLLAIYLSAACRAEIATLERVGRERAKWDAYYSNLPDYEIDGPTADFNEELVAAVRALLPAGASVLEAGCGGGNQSVALARDGGYQAAVLDFSREALNYAERQFARAGIKGEFIEDDAFAIREKRHDLVFNSGVLEHYTVDEQADFLRGMASRSRRYVMVLVPNAACYWYWVWRINRSAGQGWPFGREVPTVDLSEAFRRAGLRYLGKAWMGASWTESFIQSLPGTDAAVRDQLVEIHRSGVIPDFSRGYLLAALGCVDECDEPLPEPWCKDRLIIAPETAEVLATLGDSLAAQLSVGNALTAERQSVARLSDAVAKFKDTLAERERLIVCRDAQLAERDRLVAEQEQILERRDEQIRDLGAALEAERARLNADHAALAQTLAMTQQKAEEVSRWAQSLQQRPLQYWAKRRGLATARAILGLLPISTTTRFRLRNAYLRLRRRLSSAPGSTALSLPDALAAEALVESTLPALDLPAGSGPDVYVFGVIDWSFRIQRPQHLALELARRGHRVFYVSPAFRDVPSAGYQFERIDAALPVWQIHLQIPGAPSIYADAPDPQTLAVLQAGLARFMVGAQSDAAIAMVDHAFWSGLAEAMPNTRLVYDCMDHHEGFGGVAPGLLALERHLIQSADLVLTSSAWLEKEVGSQARANATVRNAGDFEHFSVAPDPVFRDEQGRQVIGYFGAIADWFDVELVARVAEAHPECLILLIGNDTVGAARRLARHANVKALGERPYAELPFYLHGFDVCLMPFLVQPLTLATNPVKIYEYLAAGKPVVAVDLPEMAQFGDRVRSVEGHDAFVAAVGEALAENRSGNPGGEARIAFARENTWAERASAIETALASLAEPRVSVVILCYNNIELSKRCIDSVLTVSDYPALEVVIVDNASTDGSADYLRELGREHPEIKLVLNEKNLGYAAGNNAGLAVATGDYLVLLNNDTEVTPGWVRTLLRHFRRDPQIGLLGPVTNNIGNEARIALDYPDSEGMRVAAARHTLSHMGRQHAMNTLAFFCVMLPRRVLDACGLLCEDYGLGWFEDDDYCRRVQSHGFSLVLAEDVFIHHELSASFGKLPSKEKQALFERNKAIYESKWGQWQPHEYR